MGRLGRRCRELYFALEGQLFVLNGAKVALMLLHSPSFCVGLGALAHRKFDKMCRPGKMNVQ